MIIFEQTFSKHIVLFLFKQYYLTVDDMHYLTPDPGLKFLA